VLLAAAILAASAWASGWQRDTWGARFGTFGCALAVLGLGLVWRSRASSLVASSDPGQGAGSDTWRARGAALWLAIVAIAAAWDVLGLLTPGDQHHLTLSAMELAYQALHALLFAYWLAIGFVLARMPLGRPRR
jgi:hypothetical protein